MAALAGRFLGHPIASWDDVATPLLGTPLAAYEPLATRLDPKVVATLIEPEASAAVAAPAPAAAPAKAPAKAPAATPTPVATAAADSAEITIEDFAKVDLRVAKVLAADFIEGSDKLLRLSVDLGTEQRTIFAGIRGAYEPEALVGRHVVVVANLKPRKMRFGVSQGMVLAASGDGTGVFLVSPEAGGVAGMRVK
jgi:methionyl-tRNA synthetase